jgi:hypothetical protein
MGSNIESERMSFFNSLMLTFFLSAILIVLAYLILWGGRFYGLFVFASAAVPILGAKFARLRTERLIPDIIFGAIDTGLLTMAALVGAAAFGIIGAIVGGVIGDAVTDGIAGFFEGSISEWLRKHGIDESRTALGSACGKMAGCLLGSGIVLMLSSIFGITRTLSAF